MKLWTGLGNPGARYAGNRHNIGFMAVDALARAHGFGPWRARFQGQVAEGRLGDQRITLLKPETYMNLSGQSVRAALDYLNLGPANLTVFHDEIDLAPGKLRLKSGGGHAGHNGLRSVHAHLGEGYARVRLGVGHPGHKDAVAGFVLNDFAKADQDWLGPLLDGICDGAPALANGDGAQFLNAVGLRLTPPRNTGEARDIVRPDGSPRNATASGAGPDTPPAPDTRTAMQRLADRFR
jgi:peptidyl-tRNA hydrolase, PTH1 family